ncbi:MAG: CAP domain-containing protein [Actinomycetota bacterium]|nr:CAP domain-containing protein [Actinomycetota bacterium]
MRKRRLTTILTILTLSAVALPVAAVNAHERAPGTCYSYLADELAFGKKTNHARAAHDVPKLRLDPQLSYVARTHTSDMVRKAELYHSPGTEITHRVTRWITLGENIGVGPADDVAGLQKAFMHSPDHKANLLNPDYRYVGIGVVVADDTLWVTLDFEGAKNPGTTLRLPSC